MTLLRDLPSSTYHSQYMWRHAAETSACAEPSEVCSTRGGEPQKHLRGARGQPRVVEVAEAHGHAALRVVPRRAHDRRAIRNLAPARRNTWRHQLTAMHTEGFMPPSWGTAQLM
jgi:hypothetical protein